MNTCLLPDRTRNPSLCEVEIIFAAIPIAPLHRGYSTSLLGGSLGFHSTTERGTVKEGTRADEVT